MTQPTTPKRTRNWHASDLRAAVQLAADASSGVTHIAEGVHQAVWSTLGVTGGAQAGQTKGLTGLIYRGVTQITQRIANSLSHTLERLEPLFESVENAAPDTPKREAVLAALNGVIGDRLAASNNPLATKMALRWQGKVLNWQAPPPKAAVTNKVLLLIHGLCMNDLQWRSAVADTENTHDHGQACADSLGYTPVYLRYNSGLHVSENGAQLAQQLQQLQEHWPLPIREISVLAHSMGGLVIRSALYTANQTASSSNTPLWPTRVKNIVFLGTPHHGAPLERAGNWIDVVLGSSRYTAPFARLGQLRSAGITDLRYGHVVDADWRGRDRFR
ncbi:MAG: alpha/beta fold hydrolase, partial [Herbaspirillum sp.]